MGGCRGTVGEEDKEALLAAATAEGTSEGGAISRGTDREREAPRENSSQ